MPEEILTPNAKVNEHIRDLRKIMQTHACDPVVVQLASKIIDIAYDYGKKDAYEEFVAHEKA